MPLCSSHLQSTGNAVQQLLCWHYESAALSEPLPTDQNMLRHKFYSTCQFLIWLGSPCLIYMANMYLMRMSDHTYRCAGASVLLWKI